MLEIYLLALIAFFVTIDPIGTTPIFVALTRGNAPAENRAMAIKGVLIGLVILTLFMLAGEAALTKLGISLPAFRIAGGLMLLAIAYEMIFGKRAQRRGDSADTIKDETPGDDITVFPLAIPLIAGPGAITAVMLQAGSIDGDIKAFALIWAALVTTLASLLACLLLANAIAHRLGPALVNAFSRLLGLLLAALAVQFIIDGIKRAFLL